jgi:hypothetical protein
MIRVHKPATPPAVLTAQETAAATQAHCTAYDSAPDEYRIGARTFSDGDFDRSIYAAEEVREALQDAQHRKCAFCESFFDHVAYGDIEHFRPKGGFRQRDETHCGAPDTTGSSTNGRTSSPRANSATSGSSGTSFRCATVGAGAARITTTSRMRNRFSSIPRHKIRKLTSVFTERFPLRRTGALKAKRQSRCWAWIAMN